MKWVHHNLDSRKKHLPRLLENVRLPLVKPQFLLDVIEQEPLLKNNKVNFIFCWLFFLEFEGGGFVFLKK